MGNFKRTFLKSSSKSQAKSVCGRGRSQQSSISKGVASLRQSNHVFRTICALLLSLLMTVSFFVSAVPKNAEALPNSETSTYMWYSIGGAKGGFNVMGVTNGSPAVKVTYGSGNGNGFEVVAKVDTSQTSSGNGLKYSTNGQTITYQGIEFTQTLSIVNDDAYVRISYDVHNPTNVSHVVSLGNWTDVMIGNDDTAPIYPTSTGARMANSKGENSQFNMICKNAYGVNDVDTLWFGQYGQSYANVFGNSTTSALTGVDSGIAIGWKNRTIPAGETRTFSYLLGIGENAEPPQISGSINAVVHPQTVDVSAQVKDAVNRTDRLYYVLDRDTELETDPVVLDTHKFTANSFVEMKGVIQRPTSWQVGEVHTVSVWVMNEANAMSPIVTKVIVIKDDEDAGDVMQEGVNVTLHFKPGSIAGVAATGTPPEDKQVFELQAVELPSNTFTAPVINGMTMKFAGWKAQDGKMYQPGVKFTMPERTSIIDAATRTNYDFEAVWMSDGKSIYYVDIYTQQKDGTYKKKQELTEIGDENKTVNISSRVSEFAQEGYKLHSGNPTKLSGTVTPITSNNPLRLALYYDLEQFNVTFNVDDMPGLSDSTATLYYNTSLADSTTASMRVLTDQQWATFGGWFNRTNGKGAQLTDQRRIKANETYYAYWVPKIKQMTFDYNYSNWSGKPTVSSTTKPVEETRAEGSYANLGVKLATGNLPAALPDWTDDNGVAWRFDKWVVDGGQVVGGRAGRTVEVTDATVFRVDQSAITARASWYRVYPVTLTNNLVAGGTADLTFANAQGQTTTLNTAADGVGVTANCQQGSAATVSFAPKDNYQVAHITVNGVNYDQTIGSGKLTLRDIKEAKDVQISYVKSPSDMNFDFAYVDAETGRTPQNAALATTPPAKQGLVRAANRPGEGIYQDIALKTSGMPAIPADWQDTTGKFWRFDGWYIDGSFVIGAESGQEVKVDENTQYTIRYNAEAELGYDTMTATAHWREVLPLTATSNTGGKLARVDTDSNQVITSPYHEIGSNAAVTFNPNSGYTVSHVMVDGVWDDSWIEMGRVEFPDYRAAHTVYVEFVKDPDPPVKEIGSIKFSPNGGTGTPAGISGEVGTSTAGNTFPIASPVRGGYAFNGWNTQADGKGVDVTAYPATFAKGTTYYYAKWEKVDTSQPDPSPTPGEETGYIKFSANGGKGTPAGISGTVGASTAGKVWPSMVPQRDGYVFQGWNTKSDGTGAMVASYPATFASGTTTYYAVWKEMGLTPDPEPEPGVKLGFIKFDANGGSGTPAGIQGEIGTAVVGKTFPATVPVRTGYVFEGWNTVADGSGSMVNAYPATYPADGSTIIYYAQWSKATPYTPIEPDAPASYIRFNTNGGTGTPMGISGKVGDAVTQLFPATIPQKGTDVFLGWFTAPTGGEAVTAYPAALTTPGTTYYYAHWQAASTPVPTPPDDPDNEITTIAFDANGGNGTPAYIEGAAGDAITASWPTMVPNRSGYVFAGWFTAPGGDDPESEAGDEVTAYPATFPAQDVTYYAQWNKVPDPDPDDPTPNPTPVPDPEPVPNPDPATVSIMFSANGGNGTPANIDGVAGTSTAGKTWPSLIPLKQGYVFNGWYTAPVGGTHVTALPATFPTTHTTYYAQWIKADDTGHDPVPEPGDAIGTIKFDTQGGAGTLPVVTGKSGDAITAAWPTTVPTKEGAVFAGWFTAPADESGVGGAEVDAYPAVYPDNTTVIYYAHWQTIPDPGPNPTPDPDPVPNPDPLIISFMFNANGGNGTPGNVEGVAGQSTADKVWPAMVPQRTGYVFNGWFDAPEGGNAVTAFPAAFPNVNTTYYAQWIPADPTKPDNPVGPTKPYGYIKFDVTGGYGAPVGIEGESGTSTAGHIFPTANPLKTGYVFAGWNTQADGSGSAVVSYPATFTEGTTVYYAQWLEVKDPTKPDPTPAPGEEMGYIKFSANGGVGAPADITGTIGASTASYTFPAAIPARDGYAFAGWNTLANGTGSVVTALPETFASGTTIYYAMWQKVDPTKPDPAPTPEPTPDPGYDNPESYILFDANGGSGTPAQIKGEASSSTAGHTFPVLKPVRSGYVFTGWNTLANPTEADPGTVVTTLPATFPPVDPADATQGTSVTYYAMWKAVDPTAPDPTPTPGPNPDPNQGTIAFDVQGGIGAPASITGVAGSAITMSFPGNIPTKTGFAFAGWNTKADGTGNYVTSYPQTYPDGETLVYYARWNTIGGTTTPDPEPTPEPEHGYIKFDANGGTGAPGLVAGNVGDKVTAAFPTQTPLRSGYSFNGWNTVQNPTDENPGTMVSAFTGSLSTFAKGTTVLYAQWLYTAKPAPVDPTTYYTISTVKYGSTHATLTPTHSVAKNDDTTVTWKPDEGYKITEVTVNGIQQPLATSGEGSVTFKNVTSNHEVVVYVEKIEEPGSEPTTPVTDPRYVRINTEIVGHGTIDNTASVEVGTDRTIAWRIDEGYKVDKVYVNGTEMVIEGTTLLLNRYTFTNVQTDQSIKVIVVPKDAGAAPDPSTNPAIYTNIINGVGTITPSTTLVTDEQKEKHEVAWNVDVAKTIGSSTGTVYPKYNVEKVVVDNAEDGEITGDETVKTFINVDQDHQVDVYLKPNMVNVTVKVEGNGVASPNQTLFMGQDYDCYATAADGWTLESITMADGTVIYQRAGRMAAPFAHLFATPLAAGAGNAARVADQSSTLQEVTQDTELTVVFTQDGAPAPNPDDPTYSISVELTGGMGSIASNYTSIAAGDDRTVSWTVQDGYRVKKVSVTRAGITQVTNYPDPTELSSLTFENIESDIAVVVELEAYIPEPDPDDPTPSPAPDPTPTPDPTPGVDYPESYILFDANGGSGAPAQIKGKAGDPIADTTLPSVTPTRAGFVFTGWNTLAAPTETNPGTVITALPATYPGVNAADATKGTTVTYYAQWQAIDPTTPDPTPTPGPNPDATEGTIAFDSQGGTGAPAALTGASGSAITQAFPGNVPVKTGYTFTGWNTKADGTGDAVTAYPATFPDGETVVYYAQWLKNATPTKPVDPSPREQKYDLVTSITSGMGTITETTRQISEGEEVSVVWKANAGSYVSKVEIDGVERPEYVYKLGQAASKQGLLSGGSVKLTMNQNHTVVVTLVDSPALQISVNNTPADQLAVIPYGEPINLTATIAPYTLPAGTKVVYHYRGVDKWGTPLTDWSTHKPTDVGNYEVYATAEGQRDSAPVSLRIVPQTITIEATYPKDKAPAGIQVKDSNGADLTAESYGYKLAGGSVLTAAGLKSDNSPEVKAALAELLGEVTAKTYHQTGSVDTTDDLAFAKPKPGTYELVLTFANVSRTDTTYTDRDDFLVRKAYAATTDYYEVGNYLVRFVDKPIQIEKTKLDVDIQDASKKSKNYFTENDVYDTPASLLGRSVTEADGVKIIYAKKTPQGGYERISAKPTAPGEYLVMAEGNPNYFTDSDAKPYTIYAKDDINNPTNPDNPYRETRHIEVAAKFTYPALKAGFDVAKEPYTYQMIPGYNLLEGDTLEKVLGSVTYTCTTPSGDVFNKANPKPGMYTLTPHFANAQNGVASSTTKGATEYKVGDYQVTVRPFQIIVIPEPLLPDPDDPDDPDNPDPTPVLPEKPDPEKGDPKPAPGPEADKTYIKFDANGGFMPKPIGDLAGIEGVPTDSVTADQKASFPDQAAGEVPSIPGYTFTGWNTEADGTGTTVTAYPDTFGEAGTTYYYAQWQRDPNYKPPTDPDKPGQTKRQHVYLVGYFDPNTAREGVDISAQPYQVFEVPGFSFAEGDTLTSVMGEPTYTCKTSYDTELNKQKPIAGDYTLKPLFTALGEPTVNSDGTYTYKTDKYLITVMPQQVLIEAEKFNDAYDPRAPENQPGYGHDIKVDVVFPGGTPELVITDNGKPLPDTYTTVIDFYKWSDEANDWVYLGKDMPTTPGHYKVIVAVYDEQNRLIGEAWVTFEIYANAQGNAVKVSGSGVQGTAKTGDVTNQTALALLLMLSLVSAGVITATRMRMNSSANSTNSSARRRRSE